jgi:hypothetical protein
MLWTTDPSSEVDSPLAAHVESGGSSEAVGSSSPNHNPSEPRMRACTHDPSALCDESCLGDTYSHSSEGDATTATSSSPTATATTTSTTDSADGTSSPLPLIRAEEEDTSRLRRSCRAGFKRWQQWRARTTAYDWLVVLCFGLVVTGVVSCMVYREEVSSYRRAVQNECEARARVVSEAGRHLFDAGV